MNDLFIFEAEPLQHMYEPELFDTRSRSCACGKEQKMLFETDGFAEFEDAGDELEGFIGSEHRDMGDTVVKNVNTTIVFDEKGTTLTFGEMIALAGDHFGDYFEMKDLSKTKKGRQRLAWARWYALDLPKANEPAVPQPEKAWVMERYYKLASENISHFFQGGTAYQTYMKWHSDALRDAFISGESGDVKKLKEAVSKEAFGLHFLTDAFSAGHVRTPRAELRAWYGKEFPGSSAKFINYMARFMYNNLDKRGLIPPLAWWLGWLTRNEIASRVRTLGGEAVASFSLGDIVSLALHDMDNRGLKVVSELDPNGNRVKGGFKWTAFGDGHLNTVGRPTTGTAVGVNIQPATTRFMAKKAVKTSWDEINKVYAAGRAAAGQKLTPPQRAAALKKALGPKLFGAAGFLPKEDTSSGANLRLPGAGVSSSPLEWRWGKLGPAAYKEVDATIRRRIANELFGRLKDVPDRVKSKGQTVMGIRHALRMFIDHLRSTGIGALESAVGKKAR